MRALLPLILPLALAAAEFPAEALPGCGNAHRLTATIIAGAQPDGPVAFAALRARGIATVISVDGAAPAVAEAAAAGLRYIHLPVGYDTVTRDQGLALAKAVGAAGGPVYLHCHHGRHRCAAAAAVAGVMRGELQPAEGRQALEAMGTGTGYSGLWAAVAAARVERAEDIAASPAALVPIATVPGMTEAMVALDRRWDGLKAVERSGWSVPPGQPDLDPRHQALLVAEAFAEAARLPPPAAHGQPFVARLAAAAGAARDLETALRGGDAAARDAAWRALSSCCQDCHRAFRD